MAIKAARRGDDADLELFGVVGDGWSEDGITARGVRKALREMGEVSTIHASLSSVGGYVDEGLEVYQMLTDHPAKVIVTVGAQAISCGSLIAMAGDEIVLHESSVFLAHNPWRIALGDYKDFAKVSTELQTLAGIFASAYANRTGKPQEEIQVLMDEDRIMDAEEAKTWGFCDRLIPNKKKQDSGLLKAAARANFDSMKQDAQSRLRRMAAMDLRTINESNEQTNATDIDAIRAGARRQMRLVGA